MSDSPQPDGTQNPSYLPGAAPIPPPPQQEPPLSYAPPGYTPDYGAGYQYPPPPPYAPPPRKSNAPLIAVVIAVALLLCGGVGTAGLLIAHTVKAKAHEAVKPLTDPTLPDLPGLPDGGFPTDLPTDTGKQIQVTYEVTGDGPAQIIYLPKLGEDPVRDDDVKLPWRFNATMETPTLVSVIAIRTGSEDGSVTCRALVDGKEVKKTTSGKNGFATAACTYFAFD
ncbi:MmpS family transport accessory protein [Actinoplanes sp. NPDC051411]|uniref:MmpS family transport accessory protein n=1 Tax=Actinoplanes sp. NPDC051411 TaxID=3155522 RepID=UPI003445B428